MSGSFSHYKALYLAYMCQPKQVFNENSNTFWVSFNLHEYSLIHITLLVVGYAYVAGNFSQYKTVYLAHMYEPTNSANFVKRIQISFEYNSLGANTGLIYINRLIVNTNVSGSTNNSQHKSKSNWKLGHLMSYLGLNHLTKIYGQILNISDMILTFIEYSSTYVNIILNCKRFLTG